MALLGFTPTTLVPNTMGDVRALLISNPNSTSITERLTRSVVAELRAVPGMKVRAQFTGHSGHATAMVTGMTRDDFDVIVCMGGDGTVHEVVNGLLGSSDDGRPGRTAEELPAIAVIPSGSANVLAGAMGLPREARLAARVIGELLTEGRERRLTVGRAGERWFVVNTGMGIDADVVSTIEDVRAEGKSAHALRYLPAVMAAWNRVRQNPPRLTAEVNGEVVGENLPLVIVSNSNPWTFLGDLAVVTNPGTRLDTGLGFFGMTSLQGVRGLVGALRLTGTGDSMWRALKVAEREIRFDDVDHVRLRSERPLNLQIDGEYVDERDHLDITCARGAISFIAPDTAREYAQETGDQPWWARLTAMLGRRVRALMLPRAGGR